MAKKKKSKKSISLTLTWGKIVQVCLFFLIAMSWSFILGVLTGRGYFDRYLKFLFESGIGSNNSVHRKEKHVLVKPDEFQFYKKIAGGSPESVAIVSKVKERKTNSAAYSFIFQVAAFKNKKKADEIKKSLKRYGFDAHVISKKIKDKVWHKVYVFLKGPIEREIKLRKILKELGLGKPVIVEKR